MQNRNHNEVSSGKALIGAVKQGDLTLLKSLLEEKAEINAVNEEGQSALVCAAISGQMACLQVLIQAGAKLNIQDRSGYSALMWAIGNVKLDCAATLIQAKASLELQDNEGETALTLAAIASTQGCYDAIGMLLAAGAQLNHMNKEKHTAIDIAIQQGFRIKDVVALLLNEGALTSQPTKMLSYLQAQDKSNLTTYICYHLFYQQQENLRMQADVDANLLLNQEDLQKLAAELDILPKPSKELWDKESNILKLKLDEDTEKRIPLDLLNMISEYDNPYQRFGIFKFKPSATVESKPEALAPRPI